MPRIAWALLVAALLCHQAAALRAGPAESLNAEGGRKRRPHIIQIVTDDQVGTQGSPRRRLRRPRLSASTLTLPPCALVLWW